MASSEDLSPKKQVAHEQAAEEVKRLRKKGIPCHIEDQGGAPVDVVKDPPTTEEKEEVPPRGEGKRE